MSAAGYSWFNYRSRSVHASPVGVIVDDGFDLAVLDDACFPPTTFVVRPADQTASSLSGAELSRARSLVDAGVRNVVSFANARFDPEAFRRSLDIETEAAAAFIDLTDAPAIGMRVIYSCARLLRGLKAARIPDSVEYLSPTMAPFVNSSVARERLACMNMGLCFAGLEFVCDSDSFELQQELLRAILLSLNTAESCARKHY